MAVSAGFFRTWPVHGFKVIEHKSVAPVDYYERRRRLVFFAALLKV